MSIMAHEINDSVGEFAEGTVLLGTDKWFCETHEISVKAGKECAFCMFDTLGEEGFERWAAKQNK